MRSLLLLAGPFERIAFGRPSPAYTYLSPCFFRHAERLAKSLATKCLSASRPAAVEKAKDNFLWLVELELGDVVLVSG